MSEKQRKDKEILDIEDLNGAFKSLNEKTDLLHKRLMAIAMDYNHYINNSWGEQQIYELRDNIDYRLLSSKLHLELLIRQHFHIKHHFEKLFKENPTKLLGDYYPDNPFFQHSEKEISSIFDSMIYHLFSIFDYMATLVNYVCGKQKQDTLMWSQLRSSCYNKNAHFGKKSIAKIVTEYDNKFVSKFGDHRAHLIHKKADLNKYIIEVEFTDKASFDPKYIATDNLCKKFNALKELSKENHLTNKYVAFWIFERVVFIINELLLALRDEMKNNPLVPHGIFGFIDQKTGRIVGVSSKYWHEEEHLKEKQAILF